MDIAEEDSANIEILIRYVQHNKSINSPIWSRASSSRPKTVILVTANQNSQKVQ
jgi:hypothetical protein